MDGIKHNFWIIHENITHSSVRAILAHRPLLDWYQSGIAEA